MTFEQFGFFFMNDDGQRMHELQRLMTEPECADIEAFLKRGLPGYTYDDISDGACAYIARPYEPKLTEINDMERISTGEIHAYLQRLAKRCTETQIPEQYRNTVCNIIRVIHKIRFRIAYHRT